MLEYAAKEGRLWGAWKAEIEADEEDREAADRGDGARGREEVVALLADALGEPRPENVETTLANAGFQNQLAARWGGYRAG